MELDFNRKLITCIKPNMPKSDFHLHLHYHVLTFRPSCQLWSQSETCGPDHAFSLSITLNYVYNHVPILNFECPNKYSQPHITSPLISILNSLHLITFTRYFDCLASDLSNVHSSHYSSKNYTKII